MSARIRPLSPVTMVKIASSVITPIETPRMSSRLRMRWPTMVCRAWEIASRGLIPV